MKVDLGWLVFAATICMFLLLANEKAKRCFEAAKAKLELSECKKGGE
jgi:hypothetical protein